MSIMKGLVPEFFLSLYVVIHDRTLSRISQRVSSLAWSLCH